MGGIALPADRELAFILLTTLEAFPWRCRTFGLNLFDYLFGPIKFQCIDHPELRPGFDEWHLAHDRTQVFVANLCANSLCCQQILIVIDRDQRF